MFCQVFQRVISRTGGPGLTVDQLLEGFKSPLLLLWGELDPWIRPAAADKIQVRKVKSSQGNSEQRQYPFGNWRKIEGGSEG